MDEIVVNPITEEVDTDVVTLGNEVVNPQPDVIPVTFNEQSVPIEIVNEILNVNAMERGMPGRGIVSIVKTSTSGLVDTYTITYTDGTTSAYNVTNGAKGDKGDPGTTSWNGITDKPSTFPPSSHNHNDLYYGKSEVYTKTETDTAIANAIVGAIEGAY